MILKVVKLVENAVLPSYAKDGDAGMDMTAISVEFPSDKRDSRKGKLLSSKDSFSDLVVYGTGIAVEIPKGYVGLLFPRSSIKDKDLVLANSVGVIDSGYRGEIKFAFKETRANPSIYFIGDRVGQLVVVPISNVVLQQVSFEELSDTSRGICGFGSTGN